MSSVKEIIYSEIDDMAANELALLYEQVKFIKRVRALKNETKRNPISIEELHQYTAASKSSWANSVADGREERV